MSRRERNAVSQPPTPGRSHLPMMQGQLMRLGLVPDISDEAAATKPRSSGHKPLESPVGRLME